MNTSTSHAFVNQMVVYTLVMIFFSGSVGLGTVWMRHQISITANTNKVLDARIAELDRRIAETTTAVESERDPQTLLRRNTEWNLGLVAPRQEQVVHVPDDSALRLAAKRNRTLFGDGIIPVSVPVAVRR
ncbi:MAG: hypothetical protein NVV63_10945 [Opitutus sp.]|nr:hypothetical protein [Opitutus sp.]